MWALLTSLAIAKKLLYLFNHNEFEMVPSDERDSSS